MDHQSGEASESAVNDATIELRLADGRRLRVPSQLLRTQTDGTLTVACDNSSPQVAAPPSAPMASADPSQNTFVIPVIEERLAVQKHSRVTGVVRVSTHTTEHEEVVDLPLSSEEVAVERVPVYREISTPEEPRREGDKLIIPLMEEVLVVRKQLVVREEIHLTTRHAEQHRPQRVVLRRQQASVERSSAENSASEA
jgi:uncharacterized protein (TIGR02271 family)